MIMWFIFFQIPYKGVYLYDAVIQFATALHEVRKAGQATTGTNIVNKLKRRHFVGRAKTSYP